MHLLLAATVVAIAMLASGCIVFKSATVGQLQEIGDVQVAFTACASGSTGCPGLGSSGVPAIPGTGQILVATQVPTSVTPPATFTSTGPEALVFSESPSYTAELERLAPALTGNRWAGYISAVTNYASGSGPQTVSASLFLRLGQGADGSPFAGPLFSGVLFGGRQVTGTFPGSRPVTCGNSLTALSDDDPGPDTAAVICRDSAFDFIVPTHDLGILAGAAGTGRPGTLASLPFTLRSAGMLSTSVFDLTATSTLTGATSAVTPQSLDPGADATSQAVVAVGIPADARAGSYDVTLTARLANGQTRRGTGRLTVLAGGRHGRRSRRSRWWGRRAGRPPPAHRGAAEGPVADAGAVPGRRRAARGVEGRVRAGTALPGQGQEGEGLEARAPAGARPCAGRPEERQAEEGPLPDRHHGRRAHLREAGDADEVGGVADGAEGLHLLITGDR